MVRLIKCLAISALFLSLTACGAGRTAGASTAPTEEQRIRIAESQAQAEQAERSLFDTKLERIRLEEQLENNEQ
ncbi:MAG: hypothetical protein FWE23_08405 [Chitinivibrionia bacterium]|nr:hypothetical protein [Chitinivibrionia bacterium]